MSSRRRARDDTEAAKLPSRLAYVLGAGVARTAPTAGGSFSILGDDLTREVMTCVMNDKDSREVAQSASIEAWFFSDLRPAPSTNPFCLTVRFPLTRFGNKLLDDLAPKVYPTPNKFSRNWEKFVALVNTELTTLLDNVAPNEVVEFEKRVFWMDTPPHSYAPDGHEELEYSLKASDPHAWAIVNHFVDRSDPNKPKVLVENIRNFYRKLMKAIFETSSKRWQRVVKFPDDAPKVREQLGTFNRAWKVYQAEGDVRVVQESPTRAPDSAAKALQDQLRQQEQKRQ